MAISLIGQINAYADAAFDTCTTEEADPRPFSQTQDLAVMLQRNVCLKQAAGHQHSLRIFPGLGVPCLVLFAKFHFDDRES